MPQATDKEARDKIYKYETGSDGSFKRQVSSFRSWISNEPGAQFPAEKDRYVCLYPKTLYSVDFLRFGDETTDADEQVLYINLGCPWASRANLVRTLKGLEDVIQLVILDWELFPEGWYVSDLS
jgi:glutathionyl-hydroquinone reductase